MTMMKYDEKFQIFVALAIGLLIGEVLVSERRRASRGSLGVQTSRSRHGFAQSDMPTSKHPRRVRLVEFRAGLALAVLASGAKAGSARETLRQGNGSTATSKYAEAINKYNDALVEQPQAVEPKFNKANSYYRLDDLGEAMDLYQEVAAKSKDMKLVARAKYNLGNCFFQRGTKQRDSDLQKAVDDMKTSITHWRQVLDLDPKNEKAARNIEVARLTIKDILDQIKKQQEQQKQDQQNQQDQQQHQQQNQGQQDQNQPQVAAGSEPAAGPEPGEEGSPAAIPIRRKDQEQQPAATAAEQDQQQEAKSPRTPRPRRSSTRNSGRRRNARFAKGPISSRSRKTGSMNEGNSQKAKGKSRSERGTGGVCFPFCFFLLCSVGLGWPAAASSGTACVYAKVDTETAIYPGDEFPYSVVVEGGAKPSKIDISPLAAFNPRPAGERHVDPAVQRPHDGQLLRRTTRSRRGKAGTMHLPGVTVVVDGQTYTTNAGRCDGLASRERPTGCRWNSRSRRSSATSGQPLVMTVKWIVTARVQKAARSTCRSSSRTISTSRTSPSPPSAAAREQIAIHGVPITVTEEAASSSRAWRPRSFAFSKVLIPKRAGHLRLDPITVSANMAVGRVRTNDFFNPYRLKFERVSVQSERRRAGGAAAAGDGQAGRSSTAWSGSTRSPPRPLRRRSAWAIRSP